MTRKSQFTKRISAILILFLSASNLKAQNIKLSNAQVKPLLDQYTNKFVVVLRDGLAVGLCSQPQANWEPPPSPMLVVAVNHESAEYRRQSGFPTLTSGCMLIDPEPIHKGEVLRVASWVINGTHAKTFRLRVMNVSPHEVERGIGAFAHRTIEQGEADILFTTDDTKDASQVPSMIGEWFKVFDTRDGAMAFGNTAAGVLVKEIKAGMTAAEVESVLGPPQTKVDLSDKILYRYKDMTVEFRDGKVSDVR